MIRDATNDDFSTFLRLWLAFMDDQQKLGSEVLTTPKTVAFISTLFMYYVSGYRKGVVMLVDDHSFVLVGESIADSGFDTKHDPTAHTWAIYVDPKHRRNGLSKEMHHCVMEKLKEMGFSTLSGGVLIGNAPAMAFHESEGFVFTHSTGVFHVSREGE